MSDQETRLREWAEREIVVNEGLGSALIAQAALDVLAERDAAVKALHAAYVADGLRQGFTPARAQAEAAANLALLSAADTEPGGEG